MTRKLIIDGNAVYEIDEDCMLKNRVKENGSEKQGEMNKTETVGNEYSRKGSWENTSGHGRLG